MADVWGNSIACHPSATCDIARAAMWWNHLIILKFMWYHIKLYILVFPGKIVILIVDYRLITIVSEVGLYWSFCVSYILVFLVVKCIESRRSSKPTSLHKIKYGEKRFSIWRMQLLHPAMWHNHDIDFARWLHPAAWDMAIITLYHIAGCSQMSC